ncbi:MAG: CoA transferase [Acidimicrobiia bacterium]|nr:CoA transferase [Acidimicrobiia bacterium]
MGPLAGAGLRPGPAGPAAAEHAAELLRRLGATVLPAGDGGHLEYEAPDGARVAVARGDVDALTDWAQSGAMWLTGPAAGPPLAAPGRPASAARAAGAALDLMTQACRGLRRVEVDGARLLGERAAFAGLVRRGDLSPGGSCRLVPTADGLVAVNLARPADTDLVPAWLQLESVPADAWETVVHAAASRPTAVLCERAELLGLPVAAVPSPQAARRRVPWRLSRMHRCRQAHSREPGRVVDLSSMWAGPLCANLLGLAGFEVVKVESTSRPDGARRGDAAMFDLLHGGHRSVMVDFGDRAGLQRLQRLIAGADVVIESSRPRALEQLGLGPGRLLSPARGQIWISITGYGRGPRDRGRVAFGDDAAAAAGLVARTDAGHALFCGDAIADPLTGLHAALVAIAMWTGSCGGLAAVAMRDVAASTLWGGRRPRASAATRGPGGTWLVRTPAGTVEVARQVARPAARPAPAPGADDGFLRG